MYIQHKIDTKINSSIKKQAIFMLQAVVEKRTQRCQGLCGPLGARKDYQGHFEQAKKFKI